MLAARVREALKDAMASCQPVDGKLRLGRGVARFFNALNDLRPNQVSNGSRYIDARESP
jgi:hypothetical protein